ncbi:hypothetical protein Ancab_029899 [Ancistrocladus abbreviatus]
MVAFEAQVHDNFGISTNKHLVHRVLQFGLVGKLIANEEVKSYVMKAIINKSWKLLNEVKTHVSIIVGVDKEIKVSLKYERMSDFCFNCKMFGHNGDKCGNLKLEGYFVELKANDMSDKNACFLLLEELLHRLASSQDDIVKEQEEGVDGGSRSHECRMPQPIMLGHTSHSFELQSHLV